MSRGWEDTLDFMMRDPFNIPQRRQPKAHHTASAEVDFSTPYVEPAAAPARRPLADILADVAAAKAAAVPNSSRSGKAAQQEERAQRAAVQAGGWEKGQEYPCAAFLFVSVGGLEDTYRLSPMNQCQPISGDATLLRFGFLK